MDDLGIILRMRKDLGVEIERGDWRALVLYVRRTTRYKTGKLSAMAGVSGETWWRWENKGQKPKEAAVVERFARAFGIDNDTALWAAGLAIDQQAIAGDPDLHGLDPNDDVVKNILSLDIDDEELEVMLKRRAEIVALRLAQDLRELELMARRGNRPSPSNGT